ALMRVHVGPDGNDFGDYDAVFLINLTGTDLLNPFLGVVENGSDDGFAQALAMGGYANDPLFGGSGPQFLGALSGFGVYETLVPVHGTVFNFGYGDTKITDVPLEAGQFSYISGKTGDLPDAIPEPATWLMLGTGATLLGGWRRRARKKAGGADNGDA